MVVWYVLSSYAAERGAWEAQLEDRADAAVREANSKEAKGMRMYQPAASMLGNSGQVNQLHHHCAHMHVLRLLRLCNVYGISLGGAEALARAVC